MSTDGFEALFATARALGEETRFRIYRELCVAGRPASVSDLARTFEIHPNAVRQHLAQLEQAGLVVSTRAQSNGAGRPRRLFQPSSEPIELTSPPRSLRPLVAMLSEALDALPSDRSRLKTFGRTWGRSWAAERRATGGAAPRSRRGRADHMARLLAEWGWVPERLGDNGELRVGTGQCLFRDLAPERSGRCCALEEGLLTGMVEAMLNGSARVERGAGCRLEVVL